MCRMPVFPPGISQLKYFRLAALCLWYACVCMPIEKILILNDAFGWKTTCVANRRTRYNFIKCPVKQRIMRGVVAGAFPNTVLIIVNN